MKVIQFKTDDEQSFDAFFAIYESALVKREQKSKIDIKKMCLSPAYTFLLAQENNIIIGFSILFISQDNSFCLLEYMAISQTFRGSGYGGELFFASYQHISAKPNNIPLLIELDSDRENSTDQAIRKKRHDFYRRLGCLSIKNLDYLLPLPGEGPAPQMDLFIYQAVPSQKLAKSDLEHWLNLIYQQVYHCPADDVRIGQMLSTISDPILLD
ncbi:MAG: GNAT family N-acetyltransferase [Methyloglobulus sp.]|nr:GNAT family N-acetyltransferase [Methyloglobulus sp.]